jgi:O-methyltransferase domain
LGTLPDELVWTLINSHTVARCIHVIADLGVADALSGRCASIAELAARTGANADALDRMMRLLAANDIFASGPEGFIHTPASELLRSDHRHSLRPFARMMGMPLLWNDFTDLGTTARTGKPALDWPGLVAYFKDHPEEAKLFNAAMAAKSASVIPAVVDAYDFSSFAVIADIGGGRGHLLHTILENVPTARGILFELPHVIADATENTSARLQLRAGDFFVDLLPAADAYLLMEVIHDWSDPEALRILKAVRKAASKDARLLIVEALVPETAGPHFSKMLDIIMLAVTGGRERTPSEYKDLLQAAGFRLERILPTRSQYSIVESIAG